MGLFQVQIQKLVAELVREEEYREQQRQQWLPLRTLRTTSLSFILARHRETHSSVFREKVNGRVEILLKDSGSLCLGNSGRTGCGVGSGCGDRMKVE